MTIGEGASENDIRSLPKYLYRQQTTIDTFQNEKKQEVNLTALPGNNISMTELVLQPEDSVSSNNLLCLDFVLIPMLIVQ